LPVRAADIGLAAFAGTKHRRPRYRLVCFSSAADIDPVLWSTGAKVLPPMPGTIFITSACYSNIARGIIGLGYVLAEASTNPVDPYGIFRDIQLGDLPFYDTTKRRPRGNW